MDPAGTSPFELVAPASGRPLLLIGAGLDGSGTSRGEVRAPASLRAAGLCARVGATDFGDLSIEISDSTVDPAVGIRGYRELVSASRTIADAVASALAAAWRPLVLGGCCSVVPGAIAGARRHLGPISLVFVDGHLDIYDARTTRTGEVAGMDLGIVMGHGPEELTALGGEPPLVDSTDVIAVGDGDHQRRVAYRAPGPSEFAPDLRVIDCQEIARRGAGETGEMVAREVGASSAPFWLHFDVDVVDAKTMPAVSFPVATGLSWRDTEDLLAPLLSSSRLIGVSVTDYNPDRDPQGSEAEHIIEVLTNGFARGLASGG
jgi:arginase